MPANNPGEYSRSKQTKKHGNPVSWWDHDCETAINNRKRQLREFKATKRIKDFIEYKRLRAVARKIIKQKKREDLHRFAASLNKNVNIKYV